MKNVLKIRLNNFISILILGKQCQIDTGIKSVVVRDHFCVTLIKKIARKRMKGGEDSIKVNTNHIKNNKTLRLLLELSIFLDAAKNSPEEVTQLFNFFKNPNINGVRVSYNDMLALTKLRHPTNIKWAPDIRPTGTRYSCRRFRNRIISLKILKTVAINSYGITWQQKTEPFIIHTPIASAGAMYPLSIFFLLKNTKGGFNIYVFDRERNALNKYGELNIDLWKTCLSTDLASDCTNAPGFILIVSDLTFITKKYGYRGMHYSILEGGALAHQVSQVLKKHNIQSIHLGGYYEDKVVQSLKIKNQNIVPLILIAFGYEK